MSPANATSRAFEFDRVFDAHASSLDVFDELRPLTRKVAAGASATILAYGQTGSGKTHTVSALHSLVVAELLDTAAADAGAEGYADATAAPSGNVGVQRRIAIWCAFGG